MNPNNQRIIMRKYQGWEAHNEFGDVGKGASQNDAIAQCLSAWLMRMSNGLPAMVPTAEQEAQWRGFEERNGMLIFKTTVHFTPFTDGPVCECPVMVRVTNSNDVGWHRSEWGTDREIGQSAEPVQVPKGETLLVDIRKDMPQ
jgi:hypothetical protein